MRNFAEAFPAKTSQIPVNRYFMRKSFIFISLLVVTVYSAGMGQPTSIQLENPSFEDLPRHSKAPYGWYDCGFRGETPPDVQPNGTFSVIKPASHGSTYLGMVVRDNDTWEAVSQKLSAPLQQGTCYEFRITLARSKLYLSTSRITNEEANYITPVKLRIYGGNSYCDKQFLLGESALVDNYDWQDFSFKFEPNADYTHMVFEAFYKTPTLFPYNGNILLDNASDIRPTLCDDPKPEVAEEEVQDTPVLEPNAPTANPTPPQEIVQPVPPKPTPKPETTQEITIEEDVVEGEIDFSKLEVKKGQTLRLDNLYFEADKSVIRGNSYETLDQLYQFLQNNPEVVVEIGGHTNSLPPHSYCDRLSTARAKAVVDYLIERGIENNRLTYKGYGKRQPIATNDTPAGRKKNQRVEIKILDIREGNG